ncbi:MAG: hypothetical protein JEZ08_22295 [Clostridiales bacterium]|nr:hypothetical protein [Clostridiales bacterium]
MSKKKEFVFHPEIALIITDDIVYSHKESGSLYHFDDYVTSLGKSKVPRKMYLGSFIASCFEKEFGWITKKDNVQPVLLLMSHSDIKETEVQYMMHVASGLGFESVLLSRMASAVQGFNIQAKPPIIVVTSVDQRCEFVFLLMGQELLLEYHESFSISLFKDFETRCYDLLNQDFETLDINNHLDKLETKKLWEETTSLKTTSISGTRMNDLFDEHFTLEEFCVNVKQKLKNEVIEMI